MQYYGQSKDVLPERTQVESHIYAAAARKVALDHNVEAVDIFSELLRDDNWQVLQEDGLHFNAAGQQAVYKLILKKVESAFPHLK